VAKIPPLKSEAAAETGFGHFCALARFGVKSKKTVLQLRSSIGFFGAENVILELAKGLQHTDYRPIIGVFKNGSPASEALAEIARQHGIATVGFRDQRPFDHKAAGAIRNFVKENRIDLIHSHGYKANVYAQAVKHGIAIRTLATCHPWTETTYSLRSRVYTRVDKFLLSRFDRVVAISEEVKAEILQAKVPRHKVTVIPNGIDLERFNASAEKQKIRAELGLPAEGIIVGTIGRLVPEKGQHLLIEAAARLAKNFSNVFYLIVGDGPLRQELQACARNAGLENRVILFGVSDQIPQLLNLMEVFVLPSLSEGLPMVILEAMAAGKPIIATNVGAIPQVLRDHESGLIIEPNANELADAISYLLNHPPIARGFGEKALDHVRDEYSSQKMTREYVAVFDTLSA
jgi:glycosyltransferase involved in cell wall biosynthesis